MHDVLPLHLPVVAEVGLHLLELRHHVAVVGLVDQPRQEDRPHRQQFLGQRRRLLDQRRVEALQDVRVGLQRQHEELLEFPVRLLRRVVLQLLGHAVKRPVQIGGGQVDAATIHVGRGVGEAIRLRADHAAIDDALVQVGAGDRVGAVADLPLLELGQHRDLAALERGLEAVGEADPVRVFVVGRRLHDDADRAARMQDEAGGAGDVHQRHDLRAHGENQVGMVMHPVSHDGSSPRL